MTGTQLASSLSFTAAAAITARRFVRIGANGIVTPVTGQGQDATGVAARTVTAQNVTDGDVATPVVPLNGCIYPMEAGAAIDVSSVPVLVTCDSVGRAVGVSGDNDRILGWAMESAGGAGEIINVFLLKAAGSGGLTQQATHYIVAAGEFTTAGGDADETITVSGLLATDLVFVNVHTAGATPRTVVDASASAGQIDVDMSGDPSTDHVLSYMALRAR